MALKKDFEYENIIHINTPFGDVNVQKSSHVLTDATIRVVEVSGSKTEITALVEIGDGSKSFTRNYKFVPEMNNENFFAQAYMHLKSLPEFAGAIDV